MWGMVVCQAGSTNRQPGRQVTAGVVSTGGKAMVKSPSTMGKE